MNASITARRHPVMYILLTTLSLLLTAAAGCTPGFRELSLEDLATEPLTPQQRRARDDALAGVAINCYQERDLARTAAVLEAANPNAESDPVAFSVQASVVARLFFRCRYPATHAPWLTPRLIAALNTVFEQADRRFEEGPPDLVTAMVWARTATALDKQDEIVRTLSRAATDEALLQTLLADSSTRSILHTYTYEKNETSVIATGAVLNIPSPSEQFFTTAVKVVAIPLYPAYVATTTIIWEYLVIQTKLNRLNADSAASPARTQSTRPTPPPDTRNTDTISVQVDDATAPQRTPQTAPPAPPTPPRP
ncbi:MAG: hypothetical protein QM783_04130 [Phycisphaerales bacterium]